MEDSCISGQRLVQVSLRELLALVVFVSGGARWGLLGLLGLSLAPQSSSHSLLCSLSTASILQRA